MKRANYAGSEGVISDATARDHLANERTFLAYVRTALSFVGFGFVIARFAVFMREFAALQRHSPGPNVSVTFGVIMVCMGILTGVFGAFRYASQRSALANARSQPLTVYAAFFIAAVIGVFGAAMAYMLFRI